MKKGKLFNYYDRPKNTVELDTTNYLSMIIEYIRTIKKLKVNVIHNHSGGMFIDLVNIIFFPNKKLISHNHGCRIMKYELNENLYLIQLVKRIVARVINNFVLKISVSEYMFLLQKEYEGTQNQRHRILYNPLDVITNEKKALQLNENSKKFVIGYMAKLSENKGILKFLKIVKEISFEENNFKFLIAGNGELAFYVENFINENKLHSKVLYFKDYVNNITFFKQIDLLIYPSIFESFGMTINEALYLGIPVIISNNYKLCNPIDDLVTRTDFANLQETLTKIFFVKKNIEIEESKLLAKKQYI